MIKMICYKKADIDRLILTINSLNMPVLENANKLVEICNLLELGVCGEMKEETENGVDGKEIRKD